MYTCSFISVCVLCVCVCVLCVCVCCVCVCGVCACVCMSVCVCVYMPFCTCIPHPHCPPPPLFPPPKEQKPNHLVQGACITVEEQLHAPVDQLHRLLLLHLLVLLHRLSQDWLRKKQCVTYRNSLNIRWPEVVSNQQLWDKTKQTLIETEIRKRKWGWIGHTL